METVDKLVKNLDGKNMGSSVISNCKCQSIKTKNSSKKLLKRKNKSEMNDASITQYNGEVTCKQCHVQDNNGLDNSNINKTNTTHSKENIEKSNLLADQTLTEDCSTKFKCNRDSKEISTGLKKYTKSNRTLEETSCFSKLTCCKMSSRRRYKKYDTTSDYDDYKRLGQISPSISTSCTATNSILTASSCITSLLSENSSLLTFSPDLSISLSNDSGFDENLCLLKVLYEDHKCNSNNENCFKKNNYFLNLHLRCLMNYMPKSFSDSDVIQHELKNCTGVKRDSVLSRRRNAICETSDDMRIKFYEALSAFLTLKAMAKYDFI